MGIDLWIPSASPLEDWNVTACTPYQSQSDYNLMIQ